MDDYARLEQLLADGYLVEIDGIPLSSLNEEGARFFSRASTGLTPETLLDPSNKGKFLLRLINPSAGWHRFDLLTSDERAISRAKEQYNYQREPVTFFLHARCVALGGSSSDKRIFHLDSLVAGLDGIRGWKFTLGDVRGMFEVEIPLESGDARDVEEGTDKLRRLLDCLAVLLQVGFHVQHRSVRTIPRCTQLPYVGTPSPEEGMPSVTPEQISAIEAALEWNKASAVARGLNEAYAETSMSGRLLKLWAAVEDVFGSKAEPLLSKDEVRCLIETAERIETLRNDSARLDRFKDALPSPFQLPLKSRNKLIAEAIAPIMGISVKDANSEVSKASDLCAKHRHRLTKDSPGMEASEKFLQEALRRYLAQHKTL